LNPTRGFGEAKRNPAGAKRRGQPLPVRHFQGISISVTDKFQIIIRSLGRVNGKFKKKISLEAGSVVAFVVK
jgi:hypothetical protein